jgi:hypothetical protein
MSQSPPEAEAAMAPGGGDPGEPPLEVLRDFAFPSDRAFAEELQRRIERRVVTGEIVRLSTGAMFAVALEFLSLISSSSPEQE